MILNDKEIAEVEPVTPFVRDLQTDDKISYGLGSFGYDIRIDDEFRIFTDVHSTEINPKEFNEDAFVQVHGESCLIPPNSFCLGKSLEKFDMPDNLFGLVVGKSTYARCGIIVNMTPIEPGWKGYLTIEISNTTPLPARVYADEGIAQVVFFRGERPEITYGDRNGKYQDQEGIEVAKI
ncbi:dCTP deaminase [Candidatus Bipolaricaulota bacterium]|nr:dCTP deaminase [Candidatus Bipolaricaulota bacterium]